MMHNQRTLQRIASRASSISLPLLYVLLQACSTSSNPLDPDVPPVVQPPVAQPAPSGTLEVSVTVSEAILAIHGYWLTVHISGRGDSVSRMVEPGGGTVRFADLPVGTHSVQLGPTTRNCVLEGSDARWFSVVAGATSEIGFTLSCSAIDFGLTAGVYERTTPHSSVTLSHHGSLSERYVIHEDGTFALQYDSGRWGFFEYGGRYSPALQSGFWPATFAFDDDARWAADVAFRGDCLIVQYNPIMSLSDFEDAEYCKS